MRKLVQFSNGRQFDRLRRRVRQSTADNSKARWRGNKISDRLRSSPGKNCSCYWHFFKSIYFLMPFVINKMNIFLFRESKKYTVKLGYNELGYNELPVIVNKFKHLVWFSIFYLTALSVIKNQIPAITNNLFRFFDKLVFNAQFFGNFFFVSYRNRLLLIWKQTKENASQFVTKSI